MSTCPHAWQLCGLAFREAISGQKLTKLRKRRCNTRDTLNKTGKSRGLWLLGVVLRK